MPAILILFQAIFQALTKPWLWVVLLGGFAISSFSLAGLAKEFRETVWNLWPFILLIIILKFGLAVFRAYFELRSSVKKRSK